MINRCYLEITNVCNLNCVFCPKTIRAKQSLTLEQYDLLTSRLAGKVKFLYLHLMGEPLLHPLLPQFVSMAREKGFLPVVTTNGTLLANARQLAEARPHKVQISLHSQEGNGITNLKQYIGHVAAFAAQAASQGTLVVLRLWNKGGHDLLNGEIEQMLAQWLPQPWAAHHNGYKLADYVYLEFDNMFSWPNSNIDEYGSEQVFCYALRNQIGVLVDGTVVPCCLDHDGDLALGNLYHEELDDILATPRAQAIYGGFTAHRAVEPLCQRCGYAAITKRYRQ
ncbi:MAG: radical SAM/SPASM domain-containing protein [Muribaculaceae bacterium]